MSLTIVADPGHGGKDPGAVYDGVQEKDLALEHGLALANELRGRGHDVHLTRASDRFVPIDARADFSDEHDADVFVSVHVNASARAEANGAWVIHDDRTRPENGLALAEHVFRHLAAIPGLADPDPLLEVYPDGSPWVGNRQLGVVSQTAAPAILVELGFLTNPEDLAQLQDVRFRPLIAAAIADGVEGWDVARVRPAPPRELSIAEALGLPVHQVARPAETTAAFLARIAGRLEELAA